MLDLVHRRRHKRRGAIDDLARLIFGHGLDVLLIDGDQGVKSDLEMYREFVRAGGLIALHDIAMFPDTWGRGFDVGILWPPLARSAVSQDRAWC